MMASMGERVAILGAGKMGEALLSGLLRAGRDPADLLLTARRPARAEELATRYGVAAADNPTAAKTADTLVLTVKPQDMSGLLDELGAVLSPERLVVSLAAGIPCAFIEARLAEGTPVVR